MHTFNHWFEKALWQSRLAAVLAVLGSLAVALVVFVVATVDALALFVRAAQYADPGLADAARSALRPTIIADVIGALDMYVLAAVMLIFALGIYEIFISKLDVAKQDEVGDDLLLIRNVDDLKNRLASMVVLLLVIKFVQLALQIKYDGVTELLALAAAILLIGGALFLTHKRSSAEH